MKKRILAVVFLLSIITETLSACRTVPAASSSDGVSSDAVLATDATTGTATTPRKESTTTSTASSSKKSATTTSTSTTTSATMPTVSVDVEVQVEDTIITNDEIPEPTGFAPIDNIRLNTQHTPVAESDYYQYATSGEKEKALYKSIVDTISKSNSVVNVAKLAVSYDEVVSAFQKVLTDYPQYFYVSRSCMLARSVDGATIHAIVLLYTDGDTTDEFDENMNVLQRADRTLINRKIDAVQTATENIVSGISTQTPDVIKEKQIHDYIAETVTYDHAAAENVDTYTTTIPHAFDLYGAAVQETAVCEGYAKWFQYLCYAVGIQATQVVGTSNGGNHMWNAVLIDEAWYQIDVTWNDIDTLTGYSYFNLTDKAMATDHVVDSSVIAKPSCHSTENAFTQVFAVCITSLNAAPTNYEKAIANIKTAEDKRLYVYFGGYKFNQMGMMHTQRYIRYIQQYLLKTTSDFSVYLSTQGITLSNTIDQSNEFIVLTLTY